MDQTLGVCCVQRISDLGRDRDRPPARDVPLAAQHRLEVHAVDEPHRDEQAAVRLARVVDRNDVRVVEACGEARLAQETLAEALVVRELLDEQLEGDGALEAHVLRPVDLAHATASDESADLVAGDDVSRRDPPSYRHTPSRARCRLHDPSVTRNAAAGSSASRPPLLPSSDASHRCLTSPRARRVASRQAFGAALDRPSSLEQGDHRPSAT